MKNKLSIIIPIHNAQDFISSCLDSIINQTLKDIEIICVNDSSIDNTVCILDIYKNKDSRIKVINTNCECSGGARNIGLEYATGEYIGFIDSDDWVDKDYFEQLYITAKENDCDISATSNIIIVENNKKSIKYVGCSTTDNPVNTIEKKGKCIVATGICWNKIYRKDFLNKNNIKFIEINNPAEDNYFSIQATILANKIIFIDNASYFYNSVATSQTKRKKTQKDFQIVEIYKKIFNKLSNLDFEEDKYNKWKEIIKKRAWLDIKLYYTEMDEHLQKNFLKHIKQNFPDFAMEIKQDFKPWQYIFSIKNSDNKKHKIITILGIKVKIKLKNNVKEWL